MRKSMRLISLILALMLCLTLITGCGGGEKLAADPDADIQQGTGSGEGNNAGAGSGEDSGAGDNNNSGSSGNNNPGSSGNNSSGNNNSGSSGNNSGGNNNSGNNNSGSSGNNNNSGSGNSGSGGNQSTVGTAKDPTMVVYPNAVLPNPDDGVTVVCIDAGHGYVDTGTLSGLPSGMTERDLVDAYAQALKEELESRNIVVILLRNNDVYIDADQVEALAQQYQVNYMPDKLAHDKRFAAYNRSVYANVLNMQQPIDLLISLHADAYVGSSSVGGTRIYHCSENDYTAKSSKLNSKLANAIKTALPETKAKSYADDWDSAYTITKRTNMPSVLVEIGFCTNPTDVQNMLNETWRSDFVAAMADGVESFMGN